ncbi:unnamed protein product [Parnassius mnemosyne]|uniref:Reverse transcriptase domain-containing protein n=1 Tax=Parnassius mnemosyne TaxID=213953 RepID=A0AAV1LXS0_9NEOP
MESLLAGIEGIIFLLDDILITGKSKVQHEQRLMAVLQRLDDAGLSVQMNKCEFFKDEISYLGHVIDKTGVRKSPEKTLTVNGLNVIIPKLLLTDYTILCPVSEYLIHWARLYSPPRDDRRWDPDVVPEELTATTSSDGVRSGTTADVGGEGRYITESDLARTYISEFPKTPLLASAATLRRQAISPIFSTPTSEQEYT